MECKKIKTENKENIATGIIIEKEGFVIECALIGYRDGLSTVVYFIDTKDGKNIDQAPDIERALEIMNERIKNK